MEDTVRQFFTRYERLFGQALAGQADMQDIAALYAPEFVAASPAGVRAGRNDDQLKQAMAQGYEHYRAIGTKAMTIREIRLSPMDALHCVAHVSWRAVYDRGEAPDVQIEFEVHYLVQILDGTPKVFGWVSGDEQALLKQHGIIAD
ncbi:nuclear transport factor 2 family protein [Paracoccus methylovorus]|uniref:Nuclear transport factor 2 family protein n=1 Tax=Paracoccus methylovorus TaxID=2812658 RepID=A0ABX7JEQ7_9RHOB|nr:nuclear transport factor 2 family protein [Paracoccus methylovorus]QRZ12712.1 nuclear transport factor 2 family protein [Paracoccus methylovorus]